MNELPVVWNNKSGTAIPFSWNNTTRSGPHEKWNKIESSPIKWHNEHCLRENWGAANSARTRPSVWEEKHSLSEKWNTPEVLPDKWGTSEAAVRPHANINLSQKAAAANKLISDAAGKAGSTIKNIAGNAVNFVRSEETTNKVRSIKDGALSAAGGAGATFTGLKDKAKAFTAERKRSDDSDIPVNEVNEDVNSVLAENYTPEEAADTEEVASTSDYIEKAPESESFDELYEKAMNSFDEEEVYDEDTADEADDTENCYGSDEAEQPITAPSLTQTPTPTPSVNPYPPPVYVQSQNGYNPDGNNHVNQYIPSNYSYEEKKKSPVVFILIGVIAVLLVVAGILGGMLLMKNKNNKDSDNSSDNELIETTTEEISTEETTVSVKETTSEILTTTQETTTEAAANVSVISEEEIKNAKNNAIADLRNNLTTVFSNNGANLPELNATTDYDINGDDIPELIISYMGIADSEYLIYYYDGSKFIELKECWGGLAVSEEDHLICEKHYGGGEVSCYYEISNDYKLNKIDEISSFPVQNGTSYYRNGQQMETSEYYAAINYYNDMNWINITSGTLSAENSGSNGSTGNASNNLSMYSGYANIENAPSDMTFVDNTNYNAIPQGIVITESTGLNLRKGPGTSYDVILEIPKGETVYVYGQTSEWCYVGWEAPTHTADGIYPIYYGYVSSDYLSIGVG